jgi:hypothetical protein
MPRRSIIQQYLEENDKKVGKYGQAIDAYNAENKAKTDAYNAKAADFNAFMESVKKGEGYALANIGMGNMFGGYDPLEEQRKSWPEGMVPAPATEDQVQASMNTQVAQSQYINQKMNEINLSGGDPSAYDFNADPNFPKAPEQQWVPEDSPEGKATLKAMSSAGQFALVTGKNNEAGDLKYGNPDERGFAADAGYLGTELPATQQLVSQGWGSSANRQENFWLRNADGTASQYYRSGANKPWAPTGATARIAEWNEEPPAAAATPKTPDFYQMSLREEDEMKSPTLDQPGANLAAAHNMPAKTGLVNQLSSGQSVFAERDQQKNIAESGILARVLSGQLK